LLGGVTSLNDFRDRFYELHYLPYAAAKRRAREAAMPLGAADATNTASPAGD
jgi:hypothetical protein